MNTDEYLGFAKELATEARSIALRYYRSDMDVKTKRDLSPVTVADEEINSMVVSRIKERYPNHGILGEEQSHNIDAEYLWVCDPIDGTVGFTIGDPTFAFSLALTKDGKPFVAVALDIVQNRLFTAIKGRGAFVGGKQCQASARDLDKSWLVLPTRLKDLYGNRALNEKLSASVYQTSVVHGAVFKTLLIAEGLADICVFTSPVPPWDLAAVKLILEEAGGKITDVEGNEPTFLDNLNGAIITNSHVYDDVARIVAGMRRPGQV